MQRLVLFVVVVSIAEAWCARAAMAQPHAPQATVAGSPDQPARETVDTTRLDVERLPPEAIEITRDLYEHGVFVEAMLGGRGFMGGVGRLSRPGVWASVGVGLEIFRWLLVRIAAEGSMHATDAPPPPGPKSFEILGVSAELRLQVNVTPRFAFWLGGEAAVVSTTGDVLRMYGVQDANALGLAYGGSLGLDWHQLDTHHSIGIMGGARLYPSLRGYDLQRAIGVHGAVYIRYVF